MSFPFAFSPRPVNWRVAEPLGRKHLMQIIGAKSETPHAANNLLKVLRVLLGYAVSLDMIDSNPAIGLKKYRGGGDGFPSWSEDEISRFTSVARIACRIRSPS